MPGFNYVVARGHVGHLESTVWPANGEIWVHDDADKCTHPAMNVAFDSNHHLGSEKLSREWGFSRPLTVVPLTIDLGQWVNIVADGVGVCDLQRLAGLYAEYPWLKQA